MAQTSLSSLEQRCLAGLRAKGYPATSVQMDPAKLKGGYICDTMRVFIAYGQDAQHTQSAKEEVEARRAHVGVDGLPKAVIDRPLTAILKIASPLSNDHDVAMRLRLYEREWHFYETLSARVPVRVPLHLGSVKDEATGLITEGVLLEDLEVPGAVLCPKLDDSGVLKTVSAMARQHAMFWNMPELSSGALGIKPHNSPWYQPGWGEDINGYWPRFEAKWRSRGVAGDAAGPGLPLEAYTVGKRIADCFAWVQNELSSKPHTFNHGDVKPPNSAPCPLRHNPDSRRPPATLVSRVVSSLPSSPRPRLTARANAGGCGVRSVHDARRRARFHRLAVHGGGQGLPGPRLLPHRGLRGRRVPPARGARHEPLSRVPRAQWHPRLLPRGSQARLEACLHALPVLRARAHTPPYRATSMHHASTPFTLCRPPRAIYQVAMWFGTTPDDQLVDPGFPRRFVPRAFDAILRHDCLSLLPDTLGPGGEVRAPTLPRLADRPARGGRARCPVPSSHRLTAACVPTRVRVAGSRPRPRWLSPQGLATARWRQSRTASLPPCPLSLARARVRCSRCVPPTRR